VDPADISEGDTVTYVVTVGNIGDTTTDTGAGDQVLIFFDFQGAGGATFSPGSYTTTAGFTCNVVSTDADTRLTDCTGELAPGQGTILTFTLTPTAAGSITATAEADPNDTITEHLETNNGPVTATTTINS
jgi:subtilase family serine protease